MPTNRTIRVSTCTFRIHEDLSEEHPGTYKDSMAQARHYLEKAGKAGSDLMVLPEFFNSKGRKEWFRPDKTEAIHKDIAEKVPGGKTIATVARYAKKYRMYVAACLLENDRGRYYNTVALIDRKGQVAGKYRKTHLPQGEELYCRPGTSLPVFKTDFGTVGMLICYDLNFPESAITLALKGAEIILWPTMWDSLHPSSFYFDTYVKATAMFNSVFFVSSCYSKPDPDSTAPGRGAIVSPSGLVLADTGFSPGFATAECALEREGVTQEHIGLSTHKHQFRNKEWRRQRRPELYSIITKK